MPNQNKESKEAPTTTSTNKKYILTKRRLTINTTIESSQEERSKVIPSYTNNTGYPSVSTIISPMVKNKNFISKFDYAYRGQVVHEVIRTLLNKDEIKGELRTEANKYAKYMHGIKDVLDFLKPIPVILEARLSDDTLRYTGQIDFIGRIDLADGIGIIDWKTSKARYDWWSVQLSAYAHLVEFSKENQIVPEWIASVRIRDNGRKPLIDFYQNSGTLYETKFVPLLKLHHFFN